MRSPRRRTLDAEAMPGLAIVRTGPDELIDSSVFSLVFCGFGK